MPRATNADLDARIAELEAEVENAAACFFCEVAEGGVLAGVRAELALMPDAVKAAPALAASALALAKTIDSAGDDNRVRVDLAPAPMHAELRNTMAAVRAYHVVKADKPSEADRLAEQRQKRRQDAARRPAASSS